MATITAGMVKSLRDKTGAGMMDCKTALAESNGEMEAAIDWLRATGVTTVICTFPERHANEIGVPCDEIGF